MKLFVWEYVYGLTENYHDGGGVMIISEDVESARRFYKSSGGLEGCTLLKEDPSFTCNVENQEPLVIEFPDAGCC